MYITDLGDEHRRQHRPDAGDLLDRGVAGVMGQPTLRQTGEQVNFGVERFDEPAQRRDPRQVRCGHRDVVQQHVAFDAEQVSHRHPDPARGQHGMHLGLTSGSHRDQCGPVPHQLSQLPGYRWRDPGVRQAPHPQQIGQIGGVTLIIFDAPVRERLDPQRVRQVHRRAELGERIGAVVG